MRHIDLSDTPRWPKRLWWRILGFFTAGTAAFMMTIAPAGAIGYPGASASNQAQYSAPAHSMGALNVNQILSQSETMNRGLSQGAGPFKEVFRTSLGGRMEVPPVTTTMSGEAEFRVRRDEQGITYILNVHNGRNITAAHLHCAPQGQNGPIVVTLFNSATPRNIEGRIAAGTIRTDDIEPTTDCNPNIRTMADLLRAMHDGQIYVNVHTTMNPAGEIRGQLAMRGNGDFDFGGPGDTVVSSTDLVIIEVDDDIPGAKTFVVRISDSLLGQLQGLIHHARMILQTRGWW